MVTSYTETVYIQGYRCDQCGKRYRKNKDAIKCERNHTPEEREHFRKMKEANQERWEWEYGGKRTTCG